MSHQFFFSPHILDNLPVPATGFSVVQDTSEPALRMYITARGVKTFFTRKRVRGTDRRIIIGRYPDIDVWTARAKVAEAIHVVSCPRKTHRRTIEFGRLADRFLRERVKRTPANRDKLRRAMARHLGEFMTRDVNAITETQVFKLLEYIAANSGAPTANRMREAMIGTLKLATDSGYATQNPMRAFVPYAESRRARKITDATVRRLVAAIRREKNPTIRAAFLMLVYGFESRSKVFSMQWAELDFNNDTWADRPLSDAAVVVLRDLPQDKKYVFPGQGGRRHMIDPRGAWARVVAAAKLSDIQMNDVYRFMKGKLEYSGNRETLRRNMNRAVDGIGD